ncbi:MAG: hypothetical protein E7521_06380 [Ruminococcaceae bacterium]|nr:hypothetical protein [Oscillospiraceae bacterium]
MVEQDTIKLLRECDAGIKMGVTSIHDVYEHINSQKLRDILNASKDQHDKLDKELQELLGSYNDEGKNPNPIAKGMSWMKTTVKLGMDDSDKTVADLMTDGCDMGIKSLNRYLNQYEAADEKSKNICKRLIKLEEELRAQMQEFL